MISTPFYYRVSFHFLAKDINSEISHENWAKEFTDPNPYKAREEAFNEFNEYLQFLKTNDRLAIDEYGNPKIKTPTGIPVKPDFPENLDEFSETGFRRLIREQFKYVEFEENLDVLLIINDENLLDKIGEVDSTFHIHSLSSSALNLQAIIDNLRLEIDIYDAAKLSPLNHTVVVQHFGEDFEESGEEEGAENYAILPTPMQWSTREIYERRINEGFSQAKSKSYNIWENFLEDGESNSLEFKPSLVYNFIQQAPNHIPRFNNAKTICGFLNSRGGVLLIGVSDDGTPQGIEEDLNYLGSKDKIRLNIDKLIYSYFGDSVVPLIESSFEQVKGKEIIAIKVQPSSRPIFLKNYNPNTEITTKHFFIRRSASTSEIKDSEDVINYVFNHWLE